MSSRRILSTVIINTSRAYSQRIILPVVQARNVFNKINVTSIATRPSLLKCHYNTQSKDTFEVVDFNDIQSIIKQNGEGYHLIDVREAQEVAGGVIPTARHVPLSQFDKAWLLSDNEFKNQYGFDKPQKGESIILYCLGGVRSTKAANYLSTLGYDNLKNYIGSWADYVQQLKEK
ncbi:Rhodanese-like domain-containing protein [Pilobolus umbonatus]|nr:Rhodanese-like domain-containing protein [Pilobolus umbonatus]